MATTFPYYPATTFEQAVELAIFSSNQLHQIINSDATSEVETENGDIPSVRKALVDNLYFKTPAIIWQEGLTSTIFNQLYYYDSDDDNSVSGYYYAPTATSSNPISVGADPYQDSNWRLYSTDSYTKNQLNSENGASYIGTSTTGQTVQDFIDSQGETNTSMSQDIKDIESEISTLSSNLSNTSDSSLGDALIGVKQPYTGSVGITQHDKNSNIVTFTEFGAVGDGTTDDSPAILAAINSGRPISVTDGKTYLIGTAITTSLNNVNISLSISTTIKRGFVGGGLFTLSGDDCRIVGGTWAGEFDSNNNNSGDAFIWLLGNRNIVAGIKGSNTFRGVAISSGGADTQEGKACDNKVLYCVLDTCDNIGVMTDHALRSNIVGNYITKCGAECVTIDNESHHSIVTENTMITSGLKGSAGLIGAGNNCNYNMIFDNYLDGCQDNGGVGVNGDYNTIRGNTIINCSGPGAYISANETYGTPTKNNIIGNNINLCTSFASVDAGCVDTTILDNTGGNLAISDAGTGTRIYRINSGRHGHLFKGAYASAWSLATQSYDGKSTSGFYDTGNGYLSLSLHNASDAETIKLDPVSGAHLFGNNLSFGRSGGTDDTYPRMYSAADGTLFLEMSANYKFLWGTNGVFQMSSNGGSSWKSATFS